MCYLRKANIRFTLINYHSILIRVLLLLIINLIIAAGFYVSDAPRLVFTAHDASHIGRLMETKQARIRDKWQKISPRNEHVINSDFGQTATSETRSCNSHGLLREQNLLNEVLLVGYVAV